jgi:hypothetical protein
MANNVEISKFQNLLAPNGGELSPKALLMLRTTKDAFEKLIANLVKKREAIQLKIRDLEDLDDYLLGRRYVPKAWVDKIFALELSLKKVNQDLVVARALNKEYFGVDDDGSSTTSSTTIHPSSTTSSTTVNPGSTSSSTTKNPSTSSTTTINNSSTSSSTTMNPSSTTSTTSMHPNSTTSSSTSMNPNSTTSSSTSANPNSSTTSSTSVNPNTTSSSTTVQGTVTFRAILKGDKEVPPNASYASGEAVIVFNPVTKVAKLTVNYAGLIPIAAHIHRGAAGIAGPVLFLIAHASNPMQFVSPPLTAAQQVDLDNGHYYVNIHTADYPDGEIRGQLVRQC